MNLLRRYPWIPLAGYAALLFASSSLPGTAYPDPGFALADKLVHFLAYAVFSALAHAALRLRAIRRGERPRRLRTCLWAVALAVAFGALDEVHQRFVPGRNPDVMDLLADTLGAMTGATAATLWVGLKARKRPDTVTAGRAS